MGKKMHKILVGGHLKDRHRGEDGIKMYLWETSWEGAEWIHLAQDKDWWQALVNMVMNLWVHLS
jgi:hypothetical protein